MCSSDLAIALCQVVCGFRRYEIPGRSSDAECGVVLHWLFCFYCVCSQQGYQFLLKFLHPDLHPSSSQVRLNPFIQLLGSIVAHVFLTVVDGCGLNDDGKVPSRTDGDGVADDLFA